MNKKLLSLFLSLVLFCSSIAAFYGSMPSNAAASSVTDARSQIAKIQENRKKLQSQLNALASQRADYMDQKAVIDQQVNDLNDEISIYEDLIARLDEDIAESEANLAAAQEKYDQNIDKYKQQARAAYENGEVTYLEVLLGSGSFSDFLLRVDYLKQQTAYANNLLETIRNSIRTITEEKKAIEENRAVQQASLDDLQERKSEIVAKQNQVQSLIDSVRSSESAMKAVEQREASEEEQLNKYIEQELSRTKSSVSYQTGEWIWPVGRASYNYVSSGFGWRTIFGRREFHYAIDIAAPANTPVYAAKAGVVKSAGWVTTGGGWQVCIDHGGTYYTYYNHMIARPVVSAGQSVKQGQVIGYVGMTGTATGNHLDFKIYYNGKAQNPLNYVKNPY